MLMVHKNREKKDDRKWDTDQPKQCAFTETHDRSSRPLSLVEQLITVPVVPLSSFRTRHARCVWSGRGVVPPVSRPGGGIIPNAQTFHGQFLDELEDV